MLSFRFPPLLKVAFVLVVLAMPGCSGCQPKPETEDVRNSEDSIEEPEMSEPISGGDQQDSESPDSTSPSGTESGNNGTSGTSGTSGTRTTTGATARSREHLERSKRLEATGDLQGAYSEAVLAYQELEEFSEDPNYADVLDAVKQQLTALESASAAATNRSSENASRKVIIESR